MSAFISVSRVLLGRRTVLPSRQRDELLADDPVAHGQRHSPPAVGQPEDEPLARDPELRPAQREIDGVAAAGHGTCDELEGIARPGTAERSLDLQLAPLHERTVREQRQRSSERLESVCHAARRAAAMVGEHRLVGEAQRATRLIDDDLVGHGGDEATPRTAQARERGGMSAVAALADYGGRTAWARNLATPVRDFLRTEAGGAGVMVAATVLALAWANSPWSHSYETVWHTKLSIMLGGHGISADLRHWVNEGLMTLFFLVVGLEAKRQLDLGELRERRRLAVPVFAALGGVAIPSRSTSRSTQVAPGHGTGEPRCRPIPRSARGARAAGAALGNADAGLPPLARGGRRPRGVARDRGRLHDGGLRPRAGDRRRAVRDPHRAALHAVRPDAAVDSGRGRRLAGDVQIGHRPRHLRPRDRAGDERVHPGARGPRAGDRLRALVSRAADARAGALRDAAARLVDLPQ